MHLKLLRLLLLLLLLLMNLKLLHLLLLLLMLLLMHVKLLLLRRRVELLLLLWRRMKLLVILRLRGQSVIVSLIDVCVLTHFPHWWLLLAAPSASLEIFDAFDGQEKPFLVAQFEEADVLEILDGDLGHVLHRHVALATQLRAVF
jgi:hypothetical protein